MEKFIGLANSIIWSEALVYLCLGAGLFYSLMTRFVQVRLFKEMFRLLISGKSSKQGISSFQALAVSLSGRVGTGNIAGVAAAIGFGGPGAVFWMWMVAFLGSSTAFIESTLGQIYKEQDDDGQYRGGPAYYFEKYFGKAWFGIIFAIATILACGLFLPGVQANSLGNAAVEAFGSGPVIGLWSGQSISLSKLLTLIGVLLVLGFIIFGGIKRIAHFTQIVVPFMALGYILVACVICLLNITKLPDIITMIVGDAFTPMAGFGAAIGWGVKRGIYSNEAGQGTGPHAASAAEVEHPAQQGLVQAFSVYIDTLFVCSATAFMILITGMYNVQGLSDVVTMQSTEKTVIQGNIFRENNSFIVKKLAYGSVIEGETPAKEGERPQPVVVKQDNLPPLTEVHIQDTKAEGLVDGRKLHSLPPGAKVTVYPFIEKNLPAGTVISGPVFTQKAVHAVLGNFGKPFVAFALLFFTFTTILAYYYMAETNISYLRRFFKAPGLTFLIKIVVMFSVSYGTLNAAGYIWGMGDVGVGLMAWLNIVGILVIFFAGRPAIKALRDYEEQRNAGVTSYSFDPKKLGIKNAAYWEKK